MTEPYIYLLVGNDDDVIFFPRFFVCLCTRGDSERGMITSRVSAFHEYYHTFFSHFFSSYSNDE